VHAANKLNPLYQQSFRERSRSFHVGRNIFINISLRQGPRARARAIVKRNFRGNITLADARTRMENIIGTGDI